MTVRWDNDRRGRGIADARQLVSGAGELVAAFDEPEWVAEEPEAHLLGHVRDWCERDERLELVGARTDDDGAYVLDVVWTGRPGDLRGVRAAVFALIGQVAESATYVRQRCNRTASGGEIGDRVRFEVGTGMLAGDATFASHGHVLLVDVANVS